MLKYIFSCQFINPIEIINLFNIKNNLINFFLSNIYLGKISDVLFVLLLNYFKKFKEKSMLSFANQQLING
jgi:hypothetical protein